MSNLKNTSHDPGVNKPDTGSDSVFSDPEKPVNGPDCTSIINRPKLHPVPPTGCGNDVRIQGLTAIFTAPFFHP